MIRKIEINEDVRAWGLSHPVIEKDYVIGWLLMGLACQTQLQSQWIFKGGTCLKKCYLETYRFSEDLDFTLTADASTELDGIQQSAQEVCDWVHQESGIELPAELIEFRAAPNPRGGVTLRGSVAYKGPLQQPSMTRVRFDLTTDELIARPPILRPIHHPYSDKPEDPLPIRCYPLEEVVAEKTRALSDRGSPRDIYDVIRLYRHEGLHLDGPGIRAILEEKCAHRNLPLASYDLIAGSPQIDELKSEWENMLRHQLPALPPIETFWAELEQYFAWLEGEPLDELAPVSELEPSDPTWQPPEYIAQPAIWGSSGPVETIRFAGANRLRILMHYRPAKGMPGIREVEPYSFRRSRAGHLLFYGRNIQRGRISAYRLDQIVDVQVTTNPYVPIWRVEF